jgi:hypothetical protein
VKPSPGPQPAKVCGPLCAIAHNRALKQKAEAEQKDKLKMRKKAAYPWRLHQKSPDSL